MYGSQGAPALNARFNFRHGNALLDRPQRCRRQRRQLDSLAGFFSDVLVWGGEDPLAGSFAAADFSPAPEGAGDSFLAACL
jgi:hypothetical protein